MPRYRVFMTNTAPQYVDVEAADGGDAKDKAEEQGLPGLMMLDHTYPDTYGWTAVDVELLTEED